MRVQAWLKHHRAETYKDTRMRLFSAAAVAFAALSGAAACAQTSEPAAPAAEAVQSQQAAPVALAAGQQLRRRAVAGAALFAQADTNKDGALSKEEWLAAGRQERGFAFMDADTDGKLTAEELRAGRERLEQRRAN